MTLDETEENDAVLEALDGQTCTVTLQRTLAAGSWNTFAVPFNVSSQMLGYLTSTYGMQVKELTGTSLENEGKTLMLNFEDANEMVAGKPYLVKVTADFDFSAQALPNVEVSKDLVPVETEYVDFIPTLGKTTIGSESDDAKTILFVAAGNLLKNPAAMPAYMKGFRGYFQLKNADTARSFVLNLGDKETGITTTDFTDSTDKAGAGYDLQGRKHNGQSSMVNGQLKKGIYIQNGKKVVVK